MKSLISLSVLLCVFGVPEVEARQDWEPPCDFPSGGICAVDREEISYPGAYGPMDYCPQVAGQFCVLKVLAVPPTPAWIHCQSMSAWMLNCTAWPKGDLNYNWAASGGVYIGGSSGADTQTVSCYNAHGSGMVSVQISTAQGLTETVYSGVQCGTIEP